MEAMDAAGKWQDIIISRGPAMWLMVTQALSLLTTECSYKARNSADVVAVAVAAGGVARDWRPINLKQRLPKMGPRWRQVG
jgi:hypothetical protein